MTYPTNKELDEMSAAEPRTKAALEFMWAFTEWWENIPAGDLDVDLQTEAWDEVENAFTRWRNLR